MTPELRKAMDRLQVVEAEIITALGENGEDFGGAITSLMGGLLTEENTKLKDLIEEERQLRDEILERALAGENQ